MRRRQEACRGLVLMVSSGPGFGDLHGASLMLISRHRGAVLGRDSGQVRFGFFTRIGQTRDTPCLARGTEQLMQTIRV